LPGLQRLWSEARAQGKDLEVVAVNYQDSPATIAAHWRESGLTFPTFAQNGDSASKAFGVEFYTSMFLLDDQHRVLWRGHRLAEEVVRSLVGFVP
jgi:hypothetical protein